MRKLWQKNWQLDPFIEAFETKGDLFLDQKLVKYDVMGSIAHAKMLMKIGILSQKEFITLKKGLTEVLRLEEQGKFPLQLGDEDIHTKIEDFLTQKYGEVSQKIHAGRSRNDQVLTALRLYAKDLILPIWEEVINLAKSFLELATKYEFLPIPGYTHMQKAMPSTLGMWASAYVEAFLDDLTLLRVAYQLNDQSPLGSAAGYGVPLGLDRNFAAKSLGFSKIQNNSLYCQNSRGKIEAVILAALLSILQEINRFCSDILLFTTSEFNYFEVPDRLCSGSSLMPQKKNLDIAELLRSKVHLVLGFYVQIISISSNLISGYNRDLQDTKRPLMSSLELTLSCIEAADILVNNLLPKREVLYKSLTPKIFATHKVFELVKQGVPFRKAYQSIEIPRLNPKVKDINKILKESTHKGGTGNLGLDDLAEFLKMEEKKVKDEKRKYLLAIKELIS